MHDIFVEEGMRTIIKLAGLVAIAVSLSSFSFADETGFFDAIQNGDANLNFRLRYEDANQSANTRQGAQALTLRSRLSFETQTYKLFSGLIEFDDVTAIPDDDNYNSGNNGQIDDVLVVDPEGTEINRVWLAYDISNTLFRYGRQDYNLNNERIIGSDAWHQNQQTLSGLSIKNESLNYTRINFAQFNKVEGVQDQQLSGAHSSLDAKLINLEYRGFLISKLSLYSLWLDDHDIQTQWESKTYGLNFTGLLGSEPLVEYLIGYANQEDSGNNPLNYSAHYSHYDIQLTYHGFQFKLGQETLGADGEGFFVTPLASQHNFQGWTGQFINQGLGNIKGGVIDQYVGLGFSCSDSFNVLAIYHDFQSDSHKTGLGDLGSEWGIQALAELNEYRFVAKYADYSKDRFGVDTNRLWLSVELAL